MFVRDFQVSSPNVTYGDGAITSTYAHSTSRVSRDTTPPTLTRSTTEYTFRTEAKAPEKLGLMLVGLAGNNGSTLVAGLLANKKGTMWRTKDGEKKPNFYGSMVLSGVLKVGDDQETGEEVFAPMSSLLPIVDPGNIVVDGWDINGVDLFEAMQRSKVLDYDLQRQLEKEMSAMRPRKSIYYPDFIASNQGKRADNIIGGNDKWEHVETLRRDIRDFKEKSGVEKVVIVWTATTERFCRVDERVHGTSDALLTSIKESHSEISPSTLFAVASILEGCPFVNGSPQNTLVPGVIELAAKHNVFVGGDDFKTGQTKFKSVLVDFLVQAGIKPTSIVSYNHLGNNDGENLSSPQQFRSKEISKSNVVDDMVASNAILYDKDEHPDHVVVIKYVPAVGDSKRALDEYTSEIFMGGQQTIVSHNTCEDSLLAAPLILDLALLSELSTRIQYKTGSMEDFSAFHPVLGILSYLLKAPVVPEGTPVINALFRQRACIENLLRACVGLPVEANLPLHVMAPEKHAAKANGTHHASSNGSSGNGVAHHPVASYN